VKAAARRVTLLAVSLAVSVAASLAVSLAACAPGAERRGADVSADTSAVMTPSATDTSSAPASGATPATAAPSGTSAATAADSVRGIVERVGSDPTSQLIVRGADGVACALRLTSPPSFEGLDVALWGRRDVAPTTMMPGVACAFTATRYAVRAVDGIAAMDGVLHANGAAYALVTTDGVRRPLRDVPATLRAQVGARIYWAGPLDRAPAAYGVLAPAP
jgi:hypothetical protein